MLQEVSSFNRTASNYVSMTDVSSAFLLKSNITTLWANSLSISTLEACQSDRLGTRQEPVLGKNSVQYQGLVPREDEQSETLFIFYSLETSVLSSWVIREVPFLKCFSPRL
jgi:hypothetical protein